LGSFYDDAAKVLQEDNCIDSEIPNLGYMYPWGYISLSEGVHLWLEMEGKYIHILFIAKHLYMYQ